MLEHQSWVLCDGCRPNNHNFSGDDPPRGFLALLILLFDLKKPGSVWEFMITFALIYTIQQALYFVHTLVKVA